jgi:hypothetical protein
VIGHQAHDRKRAPIRSTYLLQTRSRWIGAKLSNHQSYWCDIGHIDRAGQCASVVDGDVQKTDPTTTTPENLRFVAQSATRASAVTRLQRTWMRPMKTDDLVLGIIGALAICVIIAGFSGQLAAADPHQFDSLLGLTPTASECLDHDASTAKSLTPLAVAQ